MWHCAVFGALELPALFFLHGDALVAWWVAGAVITIVALRVVPSWLWLNGIRPTWVERWHALKDEPLPDDLHLSLRRLFPGARLKRKR